MAEKKILNIYEKLLAIQTELKAPKNQKATDYKTGKVRYTYRSCEDILEAVKPLLDKYKCTLHITDDISINNERVYVESLVIFVDVESWNKDTGKANTITNRGFARETLDNGRMDQAQITGAASSYARKYALNGLFLIDDTKDVDTDEYQGKKADPNSTVKRAEEIINSAEAKIEAEKKATESQIKRVRMIADDMGKELDEKWLKKLTVKGASDFIKKYGGQSNG